MADIATKQDLEFLFAKFKKELFQEFDRKLSEGKFFPNRWLRSNETRKHLNISESTIQRMRIKGLIKYKKLGGIYFYDISQF